MVEQYRSVPATTGSEAVEGLSQSAAEMASSIEDNFRISPSAVVAPSSSCLSTIDTTSEQVPSSSSDSKMANSHCLSVSANALIPFAVKANQAFDDEHSVPETPSDAESLITTTFTGIDKDSRTHTQAFEGGYSETDSSEVETITADFATLLNLPAPDFGQHPALQGNAFEARSDCPLFVTSSTPDQIREHALVLNGTSAFTASSRASSDSVLDSARKRLFSLEVRSPSAAQFDSPEVNSPISPLLSRRTSPPKPLDLSKAKSRPGSDKSSKSSSESMERKRSAGLRSMFRSRSSLDDTTPMLCPSPDPSVNPNLERIDLERYLRTVLACHAQDYSIESPYPRHPNTGRAWHSRNLKCCNCAEAACAVCGRACCAYRAATLALETHKNNAQNIFETQQRLQEINKIFPYGREGLTFLRCTLPTGCGKSVCPDCCGACPDDICQDVQCRKCKNNPWGECEWHADII